MDNNNQKNLANDMISLSKIWIELSDNMQKYIATAFGGDEYIDGICSLIKELGEIDT